MADRKELRRRAHGMNECGFCVVEFNVEGFTNEIIWRGIYSRMKVKGDEFFDRINYLAQISENVSVQYPALGKYYGQVLTTISEKTPAKLDYTLKRSLCKECRIPLTCPGAPVRYRLKRRKRRKRHPTVVLTCKECSTVKKFLTNPDFQLKAECDSQIVE